MEENWREIRDEALSLLREDNSGFLPESENLQDVGDWKQFELFQRGQMLPGCKKAPKTCSIVSKIQAATSNKRGQVKFSIMKVKVLKKLSSAKIEGFFLQSGTHVHPHSGPTNCRLRAHLGLKVPPRSLQTLRLRVADKHLHWEEGKVFIFDDSFDHEVIAAQMRSIIMISLNFLIRSGTMLKEIGSF